jgi:hypothetical protein
MRACFMLARVQVYFMHLCLWLYACKGAHTLFTGQRERERERDKERERERKKERGRERERERDVEYVQNCYFYF